MDNSRGRSRHENGTANASNNPNPPHSTSSATRPRSTIRNNDYAGTRTRSQSRGRNNRRSGNENSIDAADLANRVAQLRSDAVRYNQKRANASSRDSSPETKRKRSIMEDSTHTAPESSARTPSRSAMTTDDEDDDFVSTRTRSKSRPTSAASSRRSSPIRNVGNGRARTRSRSRPTSAASSRRSSPHRSRPTIRTPLIVDGSSVSGRTRSNSRSRNSSPSPKRRNVTARSTRSHFNSSIVQNRFEILEVFFKARKPENRGEQLTSDTTFKAQSDTDLSHETIQQWCVETMKNDMEDFQVDWEFTDIIQELMKRKTMENIVSSVNKERKIPANDKAKVKTWAENLEFEKESDQQFEKEADERFRIYETEKKWPEGIEGVEKEELKMLVKRKRVPLDMEIQLIASEEVPFDVIQHFLNTERDIESDARVKHLNRNVRQEEQKEMFLTQCPSFSDFYKKYLSDRILIPFLKWIWKTVIMPTRKFKEAHAHLITLEKEYQKKLELKEDWKDEDIERMERKTQFNQNNLNQWLEERKNQDKDYILDPMYSKTCLYSREQIEYGDFTENEKKRWLFNTDYNKRYEEENNERKQKKRKEWEKKYAFYKYLGERAKYLEELVDRPRPPLDIEIKSFAITVDFFRITENEIRVFLKVERERENICKKTYLIKHTPLTGTEILKIRASSRTNLRKFFLLTAEERWSSFVLHSFWLKENKVHKIYKLYAPFITLEKEYQRKLHEDWKEEDFERMEHITRFNQDTLNQWLEQRKRQDEDYILDPMYSKTCMYSEEEIRNGDFSENEKSRWKFNNEYNIRYEEDNKKRKQKRRVEWEKRYPFYKFLGERAMYLETHVDRPRPPLDIEMKFFAITTNSYQITEKEISDFFKKERILESNLKEDYFHKKLNVGTDSKEIFEGTEDLKAFFHRTSSKPLSSFELERFWLKYKEERKANNKIKAENHGQVMRLQAAAAQVRQPISSSDLDPIESSPSSSQNGQPADLNALEDIGNLNLNSSEVVLADFSDIIVVEEEFALNRLIDSTDKMEEHFQEGLKKNLNEEEAFNLVSQDIELQHDQIIKWFHERLVQNKKTLNSQKSTLSATNLVKKTIEFLISMEEEYYQNPELNEEYHQQLRKKNYFNFRNNEYEKIEANFISESIQDEFMKVEETWKDHLIKEEISYLFHLIKREREALDIEFSLANYVDLPNVKQFYRETRSKLPEFRQNCLNEQLQSRFVDQEEIDKLNNCVSLENTEEFIEQARKILLPGQLIIQYKNRIEILKDHSAKAAIEKQRAPPPLQKDTFFEGCYVNRIEPKDALHFLSYRSGHCPSPVDSRSVNGQPVDCEASVKHSPDRRAELNHQPIENESEDEDEDEEQHQVYHQPGVSNPIENETEDADEEQELVDREASVEHHPSQRAGTPFNRPELANESEDEYEDGEQQQVEHQPSVSNLMENEPEEAQEEEAEVGPQLNEDVRLILPPSGSKLIALWDVADTSEWLRKVAPDHMRWFENWDGDKLFDVIYDQKCRGEIEFEEEIWKRIKDHLNLVYDQFDIFTPRL